MEASTVQSHLAKLEEKSPFANRQFHLRNASRNEWKCIICKNQQYTSINKAIDHENTSKHTREVRALDQPGPSLPIERENESEHPPSSPNWNSSPPPSSPTLSSLLTQHVRSHGDEPAATLPLPDLLSQPIPRFPSVHGPALPEDREDQIYDDFDGTLADSRPDVPDREEFGDEFIVLSQYEQEEGPDTQDRIVQGRPESDVLLPQVPETVPVDIESTMALMRKIAAPLCRMKGQGNTGFWTNLENELSRLCDIHGTDRALEGWKEWAKEIIAEDNAKWGRRTVVAPLSRTSSSADDLLSGVPTGDVRRGESNSDVNVVDLDLAKDIAQMRDNVTS